MVDLFVAQLAEVERAVRAVVERDEERLGAIAPEEGDLYRSTRDYGDHGTVELVMRRGVNLVLSTEGKRAKDVAARIRATRPDWLS